MRKNKLRGGPLSAGLCPGGSLSRERRSLSKGVFQSLGSLSRGVSVQGSFSRESLSRGSRRLCLGGLCPGGVCPGGSV